MAGRYTGSYLDRSTAGAPQRSWLTSVKLHSSDASPRDQLGLCQDDDNKTACSLITGEIALTNRNIIPSSNRIRVVLMRYSLHETDKHRVVATTVAADRDEALEWFSEKLRLMLTFEGDPVAAEFLLDEWPERLPHMAHTPKPTIPVFVVRAVAAHPQASQGAGCGHTSA